MQVWPNLQSRQCIHFSHMQSKDQYDETYENSAEHVHIAHIMIMICIIRICPTKRTPGLYGLINVMAIDALKGCQIFLSHVSYET